MINNSVSISVVIPAYNDQDVIVRAIESVLAQTELQAIKEIVVVDDGSSDSTLQKLQTFLDVYDGEAKLRIISKANGGPSSARNVGIKASAGDWIAFLDADDEWRTNKIHEQLKVIGKIPEIVFLGTGSNDITPRYTKAVIKGVYRIGVRDYFFKSRIITSSVLVKKSILEEYGLFDESMSYAEDMNLFMKIAHDDGLYVLSAPLVLREDEPIFGGSGLSGNIKAMHKGCLRNIALAKEYTYINAYEAMLYRLWEHVKYARRLVIARGAR